MQYKINTIKLMEDKSKISEIDAIKNLYKLVRAILYFLEVAEFTINEELYLKLDDSGKSLFIGVGEKK